MLTILTKALISALVNERVALALVGMLEPLLQRANAKQTEILRGMIVHELEPIRLELRELDARVGRLERTIQRATNDG